MGQIFIHRLRVLEEGSSRSVNELVEATKAGRLFVRSAILHLQLSGFICVAKFRVAGETERYTLLDEGLTFYNNAEEIKDPLTRLTVYKCRIERYE